MNTLMPTREPTDLDAIIVAYSQATDRLKLAHETLSLEVQRLRDELGRKNRELARRERLAALGRLAAGLAHEVRNPLGGIALYASLLEKDLAPQPQSASLAHKIGDAVRSLERLVSEILEFAREETLDPSWTTVSELMSGVLDGLAPWIASLNVAVDVSSVPDDLSVWGDPDRLRRAILNLMLNAVQAVGERGRVGLHASIDEDGRTRLEVWDTGPGISDDNLDRVFDPFFTTKPAGTGLGLAIVHRIIEGHGGSLRILNRPGGGAQVVVLLPRERAAAAQPVRLIGTERKIRGGGRKRKAS